MYRTLPEMIPQEVALLPTHPDYGDAGLCVIPDPDENTTSKHVFAMNTCTNLRFTKLLITSKLQNMLHENRFGLSNASLEIICALIQTLTVHLVENMVSGLLSLVSVVIKSCASLFKIVLIFTSTHYYIFSQHGSAPVAVNMSYRHNATLRESETIYDHQSIVIVGDKPVVIESATSLFEKHPTVSTLLIYLKGTLRVLRGSKCRFTTHSSVVLVGHGSEGSDGVARLGGYGPEELARVVSGIENENEHLNTVSVISCKLGQDLHFVMRLLQALRSFNVETKLHLYSSIISVSSQGEIMTKDNGVWRNKDSTKTVIAELDRRGNLLTSAAPNHSGQVIPDYQGKPLYMQILGWPSHPQMFVPEDLRKKYTFIDCLEGLTWSLFFEENERRHAPDYIPEDTQKHLKAIWLTEPQCRKHSHQAYHQHSGSTRGNPVQRERGSRVRLVLCSE